MAVKFEGMRVLVVDDYENTRKKLVAELQKLGITVIEAANGLEALDVLRREKKVDAIFTDIVMPEMDGFELTEDVRSVSDLRSVPIVVVSTHVDGSYIMKALRVGADDYISKPIESDIVARVMSRIMTSVLPEGASGGRTL
ncbi:MAG: response regulator [Nitrospinae bacterium]|nr:response regulator [Nitrospinota bacterium]